MAREIDGAKQYYLFNAHGDVVHRVDETVNVLKTYKYDAFGNEENPEPLDTNPFRYCGEYFDRETETYYLRARYYNPATGRFGAEDAARSGLNWYTYCGNSPIMLYDPTGRVAYSQSWQGGYQFFVLNRQLSGTFLVFGAIPRLGAVIDLTHAASNKLSGIKEIGKPQFSEVGDLALSANDLLQTADKLGLTDALKSSKWLGSLSNLFGNVGNIASVISAGEFLLDQQSDVIDQIINQQFDKEMFSSSREMVEYKYLFASHSIRQLLKDQKLSYTVKSSGDLLKLTMNSADRKSIAKMLSSLGRSSDEQLKKRLSRLGIK